MAWRNLADTHPLKSAVTSRQSELRSSVTFSLHVTLNPDRDRCKVTGNATKPFLCARPRNRDEVFDSYMV